MINFEKELLEKIRMARIAKGHSQENLAEMLGMSTTAYGDLERGRTEMTISKLMAVAKVLEIPVKEFFGIELASVDTNLKLRNEHLEAEVKELSNQLAGLKAKIAEWIIKDVAGKSRQKIGFK